MKTTIIIFVCLTGLFLFIFFKAMSGIGKSRYEIKDGKVYLGTPVNGMPMFRKYALLENADAATFEEVKFPFAKDASHVFFNKSVISGCNPKSFKVLNAKQGFTRDANAVFIYDEKLSNDPDHFEIINNVFSKDRKNVYCYKHIVEDADPATFEILENGFYKDKHFVFTNKDKDRPFEGLIKVEDANPINFKTI